MKKIPPYKKRLHGATKDMRFERILERVQTHTLSLRRGAEFLHMPYRAFLELMSAHRVPTLNYEAGWLDREQHLFEEDRGHAPA